MKKKVLITCAVVLGVLLAVYLGFAFYFSSHYLFNTKINSVKYAGKTAKEALEKNTALSRDYLLTITDRKGNSFSPRDLIFPMNMSQMVTRTNPKKPECFTWPVSLFKSQN